VSAALILRRLAVTLPAFQYRFADEIMLHNGIATVLDEGSIRYQREFVAGPRDRFDFLVEPGIVIDGRQENGTLCTVLSVDEHELTRMHIERIKK
jgi:hypothetical protein